MRVALVQTTLVWENPNANRVLLDDKLNAISPNVDLIVLPEMFTTGFTMQPEHCAETMEGSTVRWMQAWATKCDVAIVGSIIILENNNYYNRLLFVHPNGKIDFYNKRHRFTLAGEHQVYASGKERLIVTYKGWKICPLICYDLRFPVFSRNTEKYDLLLYVANWPEPRIQAWDALLRGRAIENMCYVVGVNRVGVDGNNHPYVGHSQVVDCFGNFLLEPKVEDAVYIVDFNREDLHNHRKRFAFLEDQDTFSLD